MTRDPELRLLSRIRRKATELREEIDEGSITPADALELLDSILENLDDLGARATCFQWQPTERAST